MGRLLRGISGFNRKLFFPNLICKRNNHKFNFEGTDEILESYIGKVLMLGINLPDNKNFLTESAVEKLYDSLKSFYQNDEISVGVLYGRGGNFCTGLEETEKALKTSQEIIKILHEGQKPIIASLSGKTFDFGFHLAVMCDLRSMENDALIKLNSPNEKAAVNYNKNVPKIVLKRLVQSVGVTQASLLLFTQNTWLASDALGFNFINKIAPIGSGLGDAVVWAQSISMIPLGEIVKRKALLKFVVEESSRILAA